MPTDTGPRADTDVVDVTAAEPAEVDAIAELWVELATNQRAHGSRLLAEANRPFVADLLSRYAADGRLLVARTDAAREADGTVGFVMFRLEVGGYETDCVRGLVDNLYVVADHRSDGVGSALLGAAERRLHERGAAVISLEALAANSGARRFYRRHGYEPHRVTFEKPLGPP